MSSRMIDAQFRSSICDCYDHEGCFNETQWRKPNQTPDTMSYFRPYKSVTVAINYQRIDKFGYCHLDHFVWIYR